MVVNSGVGGTVDTSFRLQMLHAGELLVQLQLFSACMEFKDLNNNHICYNQTYKLKMGLGDEFYLKV